jgi:hypothetical protein
LLEPSPLLSGQRREAARIGEQDLGLGPQVDVGGHIGGQSLIGVELVGEEEQLEGLELAVLERLVTRDPEGLHRRGAERPDRLGLDLRLVGPERDPTPVRQAEKRFLDGDGLAEATAEDAKPDDPDPVQPLQHLAGNTAFEHSALEGVAVDQHRRLQGLEAGDPHRVEDPRPGMAEVDLTGGDGAHDLLLAIRGEPAPLVDDLDANVAARTLPHPPNEVRNRREILQVAGGVGHSKDHRLTGPAGLVTAGPVAAAAPRHDGRDHDESNARKPDPTLHLVHGPTPLVEGRGSP